MENIFHFHNFKISFRKPERWQTAVRIIQYAKLKIIYCCFFIRCRIHFYRRRIADAKCMVTCMTIVLNILGNYKNVLSYFAYSANIFSVSRTQQGIQKEPGNVRLRHSGQDFRYTFRILELNQRRALPLLYVVIVRNLREKYLKRKKLKIISILFQGFVPQKVKAFVIIFLFVCLSVCQKHFSRDCIEVSS